MSTTLLLVIHIMITAALIGVVLIQRSEGGGLGIGGGGGMGPFMSVRGTANVLTRATTFLAVCFVASSLLLAILAGNGDEEPIDFDAGVPGETGAPIGSGPATGDGPADAGTADPVTPSVPAVPLDP